jgi:histidinol dehydrogenase
MTDAAEEKKMALSYQFWNQVSEEKKRKVFSRSEIDIEAIRPQVQEIIQRVKDQGDEALLHYARELDNVALNSLVVSPEEWQAGIDALDQKVKEALDYSMENVRRFHRLQVPKGMEMLEVRPGILAGERATPIDAVGLYVPQGRGRFPSMLYMLSIPASLAGVPKIVVTTPPNSEGKVDPAVLYAARKSGVQAIYKAGGAGAIAALAYGTATIPRVPKVVGPGSMWVTAAKRLLYSSLDVGLPAGPTESLLIADAQADPWKVALDLLVEAEHGSDSAAVLLTESEPLAKAVVAHLEGLLAQLPQQRQTFATDALSVYGGIFVVEDLEEATKIANEFAAEHIQLNTAQPWETLSKIHNGAEILLGSDIPFSAANYATGPNAVLPTGTKAKTFGPVSVRDFMKFSSIVYTTPQGYESFKDAVITLAEYEGFPAHANALKLRERD